MTPLRRDVVFGVGGPRRRPSSLRKLPPTNALRTGVGEALHVFHMLACNIACLTIAALYYAWRDVYANRRKREQLRQRVAYMLWVAANRVV